MCVDEKGVRPQTLGNVRLQGASSTTLKEYYFMHQKLKVLQMALLKSQVEKELTSRVRPKALRQSGYLPARTGKR